MTIGNSLIPPRERKTGDLIYEFQRMLKKEPDEKYCFGMIDTDATFQYHKEVAEELNLRFAEIDKKRFE